MYEDWIFYTIDIDGVGLKHVPRYTYGIPVLFQCHTLTYTHIATEQQQRNKKRTHKSIQSTLATIKVAKSVAGATKPKIFTQNRAAKKEEAWTQRKEQEKTIFFSPSFSYMIYIHIMWWYLHFFLYTAKHTVDQECFLCNEHTADIHWTLKQSNVRSTHERTNKKNEREIILNYNYNTENNTVYPKSRKGDKCV